MAPGLLSSAAQSQVQGRTLCLGCFWKSPGRGSRRPGRLFCTVLLFVKLRTAPACSTGSSVDPSEVTAGNGCR